MKKQIAVLCAVLLCLLTAFVPGAAAAAPALTTTEAYCIIDADTGLVLEQQNMDEELHPASITKVMTLGLACLLYTSPSPRDRTRSRMPSSA